MTISITNSFQLKKTLLKFQSLSEIVSFYEDHDSVSEIKGNNINQKKFVSKRYHLMKPKRL